ncbi:MAG: tyrosine-type recombinase/integrase [Akkermansiaceae bacterium]|nr:tyrosine-type recombinase/integrase [Armatimonadota bacterium]
MQSTPTSFTNDGQRPSPHARQAARRSAVYRRGKKTEPSAPAICDSFDAARLPALVESWISASDSCSPTTLASRRERLGRLIWFAERERLTRIGTDELRAFLRYAKHAHENGGCRWDNAEHVACREPIKPSRLKAFYSSFRSFFNWMIKEGDLNLSPLARVEAPIDRADQITPFTDEQVQSLLTAAAGTFAPRRDRAIVLLLLDTGIRAFELCGLRVKDVNLDSCHITVRDGKGGKSRAVPFDRDTRRALFDYLTERGFESEEEPYFLAEWGLRAGDGLTPTGLGQIKSVIVWVSFYPHSLRSLR